LIYKKNLDVNIQTSNITISIHEAAFEALRQWEKNNRKNDELKALEYKKKILINMVM
jgi:hypothetical protein